MQSYTPSLPRLRPPNPCGDLLVLIAYLWHMSDLIPNRGRGYEDLLTYKKAVTIYNVTAHFSAAYMERGDRTIGQMVQGARSGKQNIVEGCANSGTSSDMEMKLLGVARGSLAELREATKIFSR